MLASEGGYWEIVMGVGTCKGHDLWLGCISTPSCFLGVREFTFRLTSQELSAFYEAATTAFHAGSLKLTSANLQLMARRHMLDSKEKNGLMRAALTELLPWIVTQMGSGDQEASSSRSWCCWPSQHYVKRKWVENRAMTGHLPTKAQAGGTTSALSPPGQGTPVSATKVEPVRGLKDTALVGVMGYHEDLLDQGVPIAVTICPVITERSFYANTITNVRAAIHGRITLKHREPTMSTSDWYELYCVSRAMCDAVFTKKHVLNVAQWFIFGDFKSKKWNCKRQEEALNSLLCQINPTLNVTGSIKLESGKNGAPPRLLLADGDAGQTMATIVVGVLERVMYAPAAYKRKSVKGEPKPKAMARIVADMQFNGNRPTYFLENDGSAWDTCCGLPLRERTCNVLYEHVGGILEPFFPVEAGWADAFFTSIKSKKTKFVVRGKNGKPRNGHITSHPTAEGNVLDTLNKPWKVAIDAIQRSGGRPTSSGNWFINKACNTWVVFGKQAVNFADPGCEKALCVFGYHVLWKEAYEGDDSLGATDHCFTKVEVNTLTARWERLGHNPKLHFRQPGDVAEFVGWKMYVGERGLDPKRYSPDLPRQLINRCFSICVEAREAAHCGDRTRFNLAILPSLYAAALEFADHVPSVGLYFLNKAETIRAEINDTKRVCGIKLNYDDTMRLAGDVVHSLVSEPWIDPKVFYDRLYNRLKTYSDIYTHIVAKIQAGLVTDASVERDLLHNLGWIKREKYDEFVTLLSHHTAEGLGVALAAILEL
jgi:hypothetical protein